MQEFLEPEVDKFSLLGTILAVKTEKNDDMEFLIIIIKSLKAKELYGFYKEK